MGLIAKLIIIIVCILCYTLDMVGYLGGTSTVS